MQDLRASGRWLRIIHVGFEVLRAVVKNNSCRICGPQGGG
jgi:hypothetical protein